MNLFLDTLTESQLYAGAVRSVMLLMFGAKLNGLRRAAEANILI
jgi:hypothetical protein